MSRAFALIAFHGIKRATRQSGWAPQLRRDEKGVVPMTFLTEVR